MLHSAMKLLAASAGSIGIIGGADGPTAIYVSDLGDLSKALTIGWQGMAGIFAVMVLIALVVYLLARLTGGSNK